MIGRVDLNLIHFVEASFVGIRVQYTVDIGILDQKLKLNRGKYIFTPCAMADPEPENF